MLLGLNTFEEQVVDRCILSPLSDIYRTSHLPMVCAKLAQKCIQVNRLPVFEFLPLGNVVAREKPVTSGPNNKAEKRGRSVKARKSNTGRKTKSGVVRQPRQLSLDVRTIKTLDAMGVNNSDLFETLLHQYEPFLNAWAEWGHEDYQGDDDE